jgi:hypothetical protein
MVLKSKFSNPLICKKRMESYSFESLNYNNIKNKIYKTEIKELSINEKDFKDYLTICKTEDNLRKNLAIKFNSPIIRYSDLIEDCNSNNIPIDQNVSMVKTYPLPYSDYVKNYNELRELYERSN